MCVCVCITQVIVLLALSCEQNDVLPQIIQIEGPMLQRAIRFDTLGAVRMQGNIPILLF